MYKGKLYLCKKKQPSEMHLMHEQVKSFCELTYELYMYVYIFASFIFALFYRLEL